MYQPKLLLSSLLFSQSALSDGYVSLSLLPVAMYDITYPLTVYRSVQSIYGFVRSLLPIEGQPAERLTNVLHSSKQLFLSNDIKTPQISISKPMSLAN